MPCTTNSAHAQHTFLRGCCESSCPCPGIASYQAGKYCECNDTFGQNVPSTFRDELCRILKTLATTPATFVSNLSVPGTFSSVRCGTFDIIAVNGQTQTLVGTVTNGVYTNVATLSPLLYTLYIDNVSTPLCTTVNLV